MTLFRINSKLNQKFSFCLITSALFLSKTRTKKKLGYNFYNIFHKRKNVILSVKAQETKKCLGFAFKLTQK